jgi:hypothetical protein
MAPIGSRIHYLITAWRDQAFLRGRVISDVEDRCPFLLQERDDVPFGVPASPCSFLCPSTPFCTRWAAGPE